MTKKIYHWIDAKKQSHYSDVLPPGQVDVEDKNSSSEIPAANYEQATISPHARLNKTIATEPKVYRENFIKKNTPDLNMTWFFFVISLFFIFGLIKKNKKEKNQFIAERHKKDGLTSLSNLSNAREVDKQDKGLSGELIITRLVSSDLDKNEYRIINGVTLKSFRGTTQIDHILVSKYGIFVIETKNMSGWIHGSSNQNKWTQTLSRTKEKFQFQNPARQNYKHTKALQSLLKLDLNKFFPIVVFVGDSKFKTDMPENVLNKNEVIGYIKNKQKILFENNELTEIINKIKIEKLIPSTQNHSDHIEHVKSIVNGKTKEMI